MHRIGRGCWKDRARRAVRHAGVGTAGVAGLALLAGCGSFLGLDETGSGGFAPPDPVIAVSKDYVVETVNRRTRIWKRDTPTTLVADFDTSGQFFALGNTCSGNGFSDPRVRFDFSSRRWFLAATETGTPGRWCLAVSQSENPTAGWFFYAFQPPPAWFGPEIGYQPVFPDYPGLGVGERTVTLTGNLAHGFFGLAQVEQSAILVVNKADLEHGANPHAAYFAPPNATTDGPLFLLQPANNYGGFQPGWESVTAGVNVLADPGRFLRLQVVTGVPTDGVIPFLTKVGIAVAANKPFRQPPDARQPGPGTIAANDERVLDVQARAGFLWVALHQGCEPPGDVDGVGNPIRRVCARYLEIDPTTFVLRQDFKVIAPKRYFYYP
ncbi:MAG TPA: hypothetical protein VFD84_12750, partial [Candidatus Binatia bacterium]|nr:hypothetical protein [Candidatus Binatia bacterium]